VSGRESALESNKEELGGGLALEWSRRALGRGLASGSSKDGLDEESHSVLDGVLGGVWSRGVSDGVSALESSKLE